MSENNEKAGKQMPKEEPKAVNTVAKSPKIKVKTPSVKDMFAAGLHFGHETKRWNPKMKKFIYGSKGNVHVIDLTKTEEKLKSAQEFVGSVANLGPIVVVGTKRQAANIVKDLAVDAGIHFVDKRWAGGLLTNYEMARKSFKRLENLERQFEKGVEGRTKYEVSVMKKEWAKMDRLYSGMKSLNEKPRAVIVVDAKFEKNAVREANIMGIPVVALVDTNTNPDRVDYVIPANDDAISSIKLVLQSLTDTIKDNNKDKKVNHNLIDYSSEEIKVNKLVSEEDTDKSAEVETGRTEEPKKIVKISKVKKATSTKGILEDVQKQKESKNKKK